MVQATPRHSARAVPAADFRCSNSVKETVDYRQKIGSTYVYRIMALFPGQVNVFGIRAAPQELCVAT